MLTKTDPHDHRRVTRHDAKQVRSRAGLRTMHGEPLCGAAKVPGSTTVHAETVDCPKCLAARVITDEVAT